MTSEWFALTTRGLEFVSERELTSLPHVANLERGYRHILFSFGGEAGSLLQLRTVDDLFVHVATWHGIARPRSTLDLLRRLGGLLDLDAAVATCSSVRQIPNIPSFSVTASFVGKRNYSTDEIKTAVAEGIAAEHDWSYQPNDAAADLNVRLFIEHELALVGVRLGSAALHERPYKRVHRAGSLKPPVAAALVAMAELRLGDRVVDPCCGVGTIPIEAALSRAVAEGGDLDVEALSGARANAAAAGVDVHFQQWDARALPLPQGAANCIISNLPWGRQVVVDASLTQFYQRSLAEMRRILVPDGRIIVLTSTPELLQTNGLACENQFEISLFGQTPVIAQLRVL